MVIYSVESTSPSYPSTSVPSSGIAVVTGRRRVPNDPVKRVNYTGYTGLPEVGGWSACEGRPVGYVTVITTSSSAWGLSHPLATINRRLQHPSIRVHGGTTTSLSWPHQHPQAPPASPGSTLPPGYKEGILLEFIVLALGH